MNADHDERPRPVILHRCLPCRVLPHDVEQGRVIVSPQQVAHFGDDGGRTTCGHDATGDKWWWPL